MFRGGYQHALDSKGRIIIPAKFREALAGVFVVTKGLDNCIFLYPLYEWDRIAEQLRALQSNRSDVRKFNRIFFANALELVMDKQGRVVLPPHLREFAHIEKEVMVIGVGSRIEIWAMEEWKAYQAEAAGDLEQLAETIVDLEL